MSMVLFPETIKDYTFNSFFLFLFIILFILFSRAYSFVIPRNSFLLMFYYLSFLISSLLF